MASKSRPTPKSTTRKPAKAKRAGAPKPAKRRKPSAGRKTKSTGRLPKAEYNKVLVPVDFSDRSAETLAYAVDFARRHDASLLLLHVVEPVVTPVEMGLAQVSLDAVERDLKSSTQIRLKNWIQEKVPSDLKAMGWVVVGVPHHEITEVARNSKADLIIICTHGYTGLKHVLLGSTAERVIRHAESPVLTVRLAGDSKS